MNIGGIPIGAEHPVFVIAEAGINHNADLEMACHLVDAAADAGCQLVKFQKRSPRDCVPRTQWDVERETPWGRMTYLAYRERMEFSLFQYHVIAQRARERGILWTASAWDLPSVDFLEGLDVPCHKVPSACLTNHGLLKRLRATGKPIILSTGMSTPAEIDAAVAILDRESLILLHCTSTYPCPPEELNLRCIPWLQARYGVPVGFSDHFPGLPSVTAAVAFGACAIEKHITLNRTLWGTDQAASIEPVKLGQMVRTIRAVETMLGDGRKQVYASELPVRAKLRREEEVCVS